MAFLNKSIEDSLKLIGNHTSTTPKKRGRPKKKIPVPNISPVRNPKLSPEKFSPFRTGTRPSSPISLQRTPEAQERTIRPETPQTEHEDDIPEEAEIQLEETPETKNITQDLTDKYFKVCRYIQLEDKVVYAITYDPNGQVVYIELDEEDQTTSTGGQEVTIMDYQDLIEFPFSTKEYFKNKINSSVYGIVMTRGENMCFLKKTDNGDVEETYIGSQSAETDKISYYCVYKYTDIMEDLSISLQGIGHTYEMIQQFQLVVNKDTFTSAMSEIHKLELYSKEFDKTYRSFTEVILDDWGRFSNVSVDYIEKLGHEGLTDDETEKFGHISSNLFARFKAFNDITVAISELKDVPEILLGIKNKLKDSIDMFTKESKRMNGRILDTHEIDISL